MSLPYDPDAIDGDDGDGDHGYGFEGYEPSKDVCILLVDASQSMASTTVKNEEGEELPALQESILLAHQILRDRIISTPSDEFALVFYNTKNAKNSSSFESVYVFQDLDSPDAARIRAVQQLAEDPAQFEKEIGSATEGDAAAGLKFALWTASQMFSSKASKTYRNIYIFTVDEDPTAGTAQPQSYRDQLRTRCQELGDAAVAIAPMPMVDAFRMEPFWNSLVEASGTEPEFLQATDLFGRVRSVVHRRRALSSLRWTIAPDLEIGLQVHSLVQPATKGAATYLRATDHEPLRSETAYICQDTGALLRLDADIQKLRFDPGKGCFPQVVLLSSERRALKSSLPPGLQLLGFKPFSALQPFHQLTHSYYLRPSDKELQGSSTLYAALYVVMRSQDQVAICSFVRNKTSEPRLVALVPYPLECLPQPDHPDTKLPPAAPEGLHMVPLPFADDLRAPEADPDIADRACEATASDEQVEAAVAMVNGLMLSLEDHPAGVANPALQRHYEVLEAFALQEPVPPVEEFLDETVAPENFGEKEPLAAAFAKATNLDKAATAAATKKRARPVTEGADASGGVSIRALAEGGKLQTLRVQDLKEYLSRHKLKQSGAKAELVQRILEHLGLA